MKIVRWILFFPISYFFVGFILLIPHIIFNVLYDRKWWQILIGLIVFSRLLLLLVRKLIEEASVEVIYSRIESKLSFAFIICPNKTINSICISILGLLFSTYYIYNVWINGNSTFLNYKSLFHSIGVTITIIILLIYVFQTSYYNWLNWHFTGDYDNYHD